MFTHLRRRPDAYTAFQGIIRIKQNVREKNAFTVRHCWILIGSTFFPWQNNMPQFLHVYRSDFGNIWAWIQLSFPCRIEDGRGAIGFFSYESVVGQKLCNDQHAARRLENLVRPDKTISIETSFAITRSNQILDQSVV